MAEKDKEGNKTGRFLQKYKEEYYNKLFDYRNKLSDLKSKGKEDTKEYIDLLGEYYTWKKDNTKQKYKREYYDALNLLIPQARKIKEHQT